MLENALSRRGIIIGNVKLESAFIFASFTLLDACLIRLYQAASIRRQKPLIATQDAEPRNREDSTVRRGAGSLGESYACGAGGVEGVGG